MKNSNIKTINGIGKACKIICTIAMVFCIIGSVAALLGAGVVAVMPTDMLNLSGTANADVTLAVNDSDSHIHITTGNNNGINIVTQDDAIDVNGDKVEFFGDIWSMNIDEIVMDGNKATYKLSGDFSEINTKAVKRKLVFEILEAFLKVSATAVALGFASNLFKEFAKCETPFTETIVKKMKVLGWVFIGYAVLIGINLTVVASALAVLMLAYVFAHGVSLQKESDETL